MSEPGFVGWKVPDEARRRLLSVFPPAYSRVEADHVTLSAGGDGQQRPSAREGRIVGVADDGRGLQCLVVEIDGTTERPDGSTYHITWSLDPSAGREPVESNDVLRRHGWRRVEPIPVPLEPVGPS